ncbi:response regulator [Paenibacillus sp.]|jgi:two-component system response regulator YesN|uniref:response regulator n=1 Tax=Paenibacillus sp. TaxID=58172 RepID=UPI002826D69F|nr:response regulator [Paenibacillus sp.]MDR0271676.1 response regulator [Paenibacillus sp.]
MLNVLLVDDEPGAIKALKYAIDWEREGFRIAGEASDGDQALKMVKEQNYAVVISDIRMPGMDGLTLIQELLAFPHTLTVAVSGYDEFDYVKQCLKLGVKDYLLKPVKEEELLTLVCKLRAEIESNFILNKQRNLAISTIRNDAFKQWVQGRIPFAEADSILRLWSIVLPASRTWTAVIVEFAALDLSDSNWTTQEWQTATFAVRNVLEELIMPTGGIFEDEQGHIVLVLNFGHASLTQITELVYSYHDITLRYTKIPLTFAIGNPVNHPVDVPVSYQNALATMERKFLLGTPSVIMPSTLQMDRDGISETNRHFIQDMLEAMKQGRKDYVTRRLQEQVGIWKRNGLSKSDVQAIIVEWMVNLYHYASQYGEQGEQFFQRRAAASYKSILVCRNIEQLIFIARQTGEELVDFLETAKWRHSHNPVSELKQIVEAHYSEQISLKSIAKQIHMNATYLGQLFKSSEGTSFNDYLLQLRMNKACALLANTDMKVYEVASAVGYKQLDWFYKKFKENVGVSANEYRSKSK